MEMLPDSMCSAAGMASCPSVPKMLLLFQIEDTKMIAVFSTTQKDKILVLFGKEISELL